MMNKEDWRTWYSLLEQMKEAMREIDMPLGRPIYHVPHISTIKPYWDELVTIQQYVMHTEKRTTVPRALLLPHLLDPATQFIRIYLNTAYSKHRYTAENLISSQRVQLMRNNTDNPMQVSEDDQDTIEQFAAKIAAAPYEVFVVRYSSSDYRLKAYITTGDKPKRLTFRRLGIILQGDEPANYAVHETTPNTRVDQYHKTHEDEYIGNTLVGGGFIYGYSLEENNL